MLCLLNSSVHHFHFVMISNRNMAARHPFRRLVAAACCRRAEEDVHFQDWWLFELEAQEDGGDTPGLHGRQSIHQGAMRVQG